MTFYDDKAATINALVTSVEAIEQELGLLPAGVYATVRTRLDILEARINNPFAPAPNVPNPFYIGGSPVSGVSIQTGFGNPQITLPPAIPGSLYLREDGYNIQGLYAFRPDGYWHQIDTDPFIAAGDLSGNSYSQTVIGLQNRAINPAAPITDAEGDGYVLSWNATANSGLGWWEPQIGFYAFGDLTGNKVNQTVVNLQGTKLVIGVPTDGYALVWNGSTSRWEPQRQAVVFDPLDTASTTNVRTNRYTTQSPLGLGILGANNFGSRSTGATTGVTANYSSILGGDQNQVSAAAAVIVGGLQNVIGGATSVILGGNTNNITDTSSLIGNGANNAITSSGGNNTILNGSTHIISGAASFTLIGSGSGNHITAGTMGTILNGVGNTVSNNRSTILSGINNTITGTNSLIPGGNTNLVSSNESTAQGHNNTIFAGSNYVTAQGDTNIVGNSTAASYSTVWGSTNTINDGYVCVYGYNNNLGTGSTYSTVYGNANTISGASSYASIWGQTNQLTNAQYSTVFGNANILSSANYADIHGNGNPPTGVISSDYVSIWGTNNKIAAGSTYTAIFGTTNQASASSLSGFMVGSGNHVTGPYLSAWGQTNTIAQSNYGYSSGWGQNNTVTGDWVNAWGTSNTINVPYVNATSGYSNAYGYYHNITSSGSFVHGEYGQAINYGQYTHATNNFGGTTAGASQFSRFALNGTGAGGIAFTLTTDGTHNINTENGKCYDMQVRILVNDTVSAGTCASYVFGVLAHTETGALVFDRVDAVLLNNNGTTWITDTGPNAWTTSIFGTSGTQMTISLPGSGANTRRAMATVEWRELTRT